MWRKKIRPLQVGITGGIGSGKSLVCRIFNTFGVPVYDADSRAKQLYIQNTELKEQIIDAFGAQAYTAAGQLNRAYLAAQVFNDSHKVFLLNKLVHPKVAEDYRAWVQQHIQFPYLIKEAALLFESGSFTSLNTIITVFTPVELRLQRIISRDNHRTVQEIEAIISKQLAEEEKIDRADFVIYNDEKHLIIPQILHLHQKFLTLTD
jgi:dephospho-CoA kinase